MPRHARPLLFALLVSFLATAARTDAGGPLVVFAPGQPYRWANGGVNIPFNPDQGGLGPMNNTEAVAQAASAFAAWAAIPSAIATHANAGPLPVDVNPSNFLPYLNPVAPDGLSAIVFDEDGAIFDLLFGPDSGILGFAGPEWLNTATGVITEGVAFMNGGALLGPGAFPIAEFLSVQVHEFGHYQNLAHTVVNGQVAAFGDTSGPTPFDTFPLPATFVGRIETMYPFLLINGGMATPGPDDVAMFSSLYPEPGFAASTGTITGRILSPNGTTPLTGINVIARNVANPYDDAVSAISSDMALDYTPGAPFVGVYTLRGLTPGANYAVFVDEILAGGFSTPPRVLPGPEEFYSGAAESNDFVADDPNVFAPVAAVAGAVVANVNIIFNRLPPGPIPLGDDTTVEIFPDFPVKYCGQTYESLFVNSNGSISFGAGSTAFSEGAAAFLAGPPRIAGVWDDLNPAAGGEVSYEQSPHALTVRFSSVPEFPAVGANSFTISLRRGLLDGSFGPVLHGGRFTLDYGAVSATDGLAGYSCGGKSTTGFELETNLSGLRLPFVLGLEKPAVYEWFTAADNDLDNERFDVLTPKPFRDEFEPNNTLTSSRLVKLPFSTENEFSALAQGGDVDFYRFRAKAGDILVIETLPGAQLDTMVGLFDAAGTLLALNDDGGAYGLGGLSRLGVAVQADGVYTVGVTTWPDFGFTGAGSDYGRYVLSVRTYTGTILPLSDDDSVEVPLTTFRFPFQGTKWSSVWVNGNGNLTFGVGDGDFSETVSELLDGPPRIAPFWDDLFPLDGLVIASESHGKLQIHFASVPEFFSLSPNYFTVQLDAKGNVSIDYGATSRSDAIVGVTPGGGVADPGPTDLSRVWWLWALGTTYEQFAGSFDTYGGVDLSFTELKFKKP